MQKKYIKHKPTKCKRKVFQDRFNMYSNMNLETKIILGLFSALLRKVLI